MQTFTDVATAAYCPRQLYYRRRDDDRQPPDVVGAIRDLAFQYRTLLDATDETLTDLPIDRPPPAYRSALERLVARDDWEKLTRPAKREVRLEGKDCRGIAHKILPGDPPTPTLISPGQPPENGVWEPQRVRAVAAAKALAWERTRDVPRTLVEYPAHGVVRTVRLTTRNRAIYRRALRTARTIDGPPPRLDDSAKCGGCEYREECGVRTRSLRSLLGL